MSVTIIGGEPRPAFTIEFSGSPPVSDEEIKKQADHGSVLGLPSISPLELQPTNGRRLAIIGGGPSVRDNLDKLRDWDGDRWSIGGAHDFLLDRGIESTFVACDPHKIVAGWAGRVKKAIVTTRCHPRVFEVLKENDAEVRTFSLEEGPGRVISGSSTATACPHMAGILGYRTGITYFGCEGSYHLDATHAYMREVRTEEMLIGVGDEQFYTAPDFLMQSLELVAVMRAAPEIFSEECGGLLRALLKSEGKYRILWISEGIHERLKPKEAAA